jgi:hypothetical protein
MRRVELRGICIEHTHLQIGSISQFRKTTMQALHVDGQLTLVHNYPNPTPKPNEALIQMLVAGICNTDLELVKG